MLISASALAIHFWPKFLACAKPLSMVKNLGASLPGKLISNPGSVTSWLYDLGALLKLKRVYFFTHKMWEWFGGRTGGLVDTSHVRHTVGPWGLDQLGATHFPGTPGKSSTHNQPLTLDSGGSCSWRFLPFLACLTMETTALYKAVEILRNFLFQT